MKRFHGEPVLDAALNAKGIAGWMTTNELQWLVSRAREHDKILEIGSYQGRSTKALAYGLGLDRRRKGRFIVTFDDWRGVPDARLSGEELQSFFTEHLAEEIEKSVVFQVPKDSKTLAAKKPNIALSDGTKLKHGMFDMIFIDGSHDAESVQRDCESAQKFAADGALICGHDWFMPEVQKGVRAVFPRARQASGAIWVAG